MSEQCEGMAYCADCNSAVPCSMGDHDEATIATQRAMIAELVGALHLLSTPWAVDGLMTCFCEPMRDDGHTTVCETVNAALAKAAKEAE